MATYYDGKNYLKRHLSHIQMRSFHVTRQVLKVKRMHSSSSLQDSLVSLQSTVTRLLYRATEK